MAPIKNKAVFLLKILLSFVLIDGIVLVAAKNVAPHVPVLTVVLIVTLLAVAFVGIVILATFIGVAWHCFGLNHGGTDPAWMWFGGEPPGLQRLRRKTLERSSSSDPAPVRKLPENGAPDP